MHLSWLDPHKMRKLTVVGREKMVVFDDMELERKVTIYEKAPWEPASTYGEWRTRTGDIFSPKVANDEPLRLECRHFVELVERGPGDFRRRPTASPSCARWSSCRPRSRPSQRERRDPSLGDRLPGHRARRGRQGARERRRREATDALAALDDEARALEPAVLGDGAIVSTGAIVFAGTRIGARAIVGDQACIRERVELGDDVVVGRGSLVENDTTIGAMTKIQAMAYITAYSTARGARLHRAMRADDERQLDGPHGEALREREGPTIRRGARIGGGVVLLPGSRSARRRSSAPARS